MWKYWIIIAVGFLFIIAPFLGLTTFIFKTFMVFGGVGVGVLSFWLLSEERMKQSTTGQEINEFQK